MIAGWGFVMDLPAIASRRARPVSIALTTTAPLALALGGCAHHSSPSLPLFGAYFPAWLVSAVIGILGALAMRVVLVRVGIDDVLPVRLLVYVSLASAIAFAWALLVYGR